MFQKKYIVIDAEMIYTRMQFFIINCKLYLRYALLVKVRHITFYFIIKLMKGNKPDLKIGSIIT